MTLQSQQLADIESIERTVNDLAIYTYPAEGPSELANRIDELRAPLARITGEFGTYNKGVANSTIVEYTTGDKSGQTKWNSLDMLDVFKHIKATQFRSNGINEVRVTGTATVPMLRIPRTYFKVLMPKYIIDIRESTLDGKEPIVMLGRYFKHEVPSNVEENDYYHFLGLGSDYSPKHHELIAKIACKAGSATLHAWQHREQIEDSSTSTSG